MRPDKLCQLKEVINYIRDKISQIFFAMRKTEYHPIGRVYKELKDVLVCKVNIIIICNLYHPVFSFCYWKMN